MNRDDAIQNCAALALALLILHLIFRLEALAWVATALLAVILVSHSLSRRIAQIWVGLAKALGHINSTVILSAIFYLAVTPIAFIYRLSNPQGKAHFFSKKNSTYFSEAEREYPKESFERPW